MKTRFLPILSALLVAVAANSQATLLVSESFSSGYTDGDITTQAATGLGLSGTWAKSVTNGVAGSGTTGATYTSTGLTFGSLATSGGAMTLTLSSGNAGVSSNIIVGVNTSDFAAVNGTLYASYLYNVSAGTYSAGSHSIFERVGTATNSIAGGSRLSLNPDNSNAETAAGTNYAGSSNITTGPIIPAANTTYFTIGIFTNVGSGVTGTSRMVTLDLAQYNDWQTAGGTEALLIGRSQGVGATAARVNLLDTGNTLLATFDGANATTLITALAMGNAADNFSVTFDEFKYATAFNLVIPEPSTFAMLLGSLGMLTVLRRRRRA